jgi:hypothetical protein
MKLLTLKRWCSRRLAPEQLPWVSTALSITTATADDKANQLTRAETISGWKLLFDGTTTTGWRNYKKDKISDGWKVADGADWYEKVKTLAISSPIASTSTLSCRSITTSPRKGTAD